MRIGLDFDNTLADYDALFAALAGIERLPAALAAPRISEDLMDLLRGKQAQLDRMHRDQVLDAYFALNQEIGRASCRERG